MKLPISERLLTCCSFVHPGERVADVGVDHGYLGIWLLTNGIADFVIGSDINEQPLLNARHNAARFGVQDRMAFYLSDGVRKIPRDFDVLVCAGMGADTIISILDAAPWLKSDRYRLILQCQTQRPELRKYLYAQGYRISRETLAKDGRFLYPILEAVYEPGGSLTPGGCIITPALLESGSPLLPEFYDRVHAGLRQTVAGLTRANASRGTEKLPEYRAALEELDQMEAIIHGSGK